jgi:alkylation response protein AidB-like acyl-CoA dehydrogenase
LTYSFNDFEPGILIGVGGAAISNLTFNDRANAVQANALMMFGTPAQQQRFLPRIRTAEDLWCQGFSEPNAGSDLANIQTRATLDGDEWVITGQKVWTTLAHRADWCFVVCRTDPDSKSHHGLTYLLCPMDQPGIEVRPLRQMTGSSEFNEVFFDGARTAKENALGPVGEGWKVAMATLGFERGTAFLSQQLAFEHEFSELLDTAHKRGVSNDPVLRDELAARYVGLQVMRFNGMRMLTSMLARGPTLGHPPVRHTIARGMHLPQNVLGIGPTTCQNPHKTVDRINGCCVQRA